MSSSSAAASISASSGSTPPTGTGCACLAIVPDLLAGECPTHQPGSLLGCLASATFLHAGLQYATSIGGGIFFPRERTPCGHGAQVIIEGRKIQSDGGEKDKDNPTTNKTKPTTAFFFHEYGRRVGMVPRSSLKEGKNNQMVEKRTRTTKTTQNQTKHSPQAESPPSCSLSSVLGETSETTTND